MPLPTFFGFLLAMAALSALVIVWVVAIVCLTLWALGLAFAHGVCALCRYTHWPR